MITDKWKKKLVLVNYGLSTIDEIQQQTQIFDSVSKLIGEICLDGTIYIVKLVPEQLRPKLKNFIITNSNDMDRFCRAVEKLNNYVEIWLCKDECDNGLPIHGRFAIDGVEQYLELVQADTARKLERIASYPHVMAKRQSWGRHYKAEGSLPFQRVAIEIERHREAIEKFVSALEKIGILNLSIEFRVYQDTIVFTDWDTVNDKKVLNMIW